MTILGQNLYRIYAVIVRMALTLLHNFDRMTDMFYWPILDLVLWGVASSYFSQTAGDVNVLIAVVAGLVFWGVFWRGQYELPLGLLEDIWGQNLINMFSSPLKFSEWILGFLTLSAIKAILQFIFAAGVAALLYSTNMFTFGFYILPFILLLLMSGWWMSFIVAGVILHHGKRLQNMAWTLAWAFAPFSCVYYPLSALPETIQFISRAIPMTYVFEGMREVLYNNRLDLSLMLYSFGLNIVYILLSSIYLKHGFNKILRKGLVKLL